MGALPASLPSHPLPSTFTSSPPPTGYHQRYSSTLVRPYSAANRGAACLPTHFHPPTRKTSHLLPLALTTPVRSALILTSYLVLTALCTVALVMADPYAQAHQGASSKRFLPRQPRRKRALSPSSSDSTLPLLRRQVPTSQITSTTLPASQNSVTLSYGFLNDQLAYKIPVTLPNDVSASLLVATGAGDLWLAAPGCDGDCPSQTFDVSSSSSLNQKWNVTYFDGSASGNIYTLPSLAIGQSTLAGQAFGSADAVDTINFDNSNVTGVLGLSLPSSSAIEEVLSSGSLSGNAFTEIGSTGNVLSGLWGASSSSSSTPRILSLGLQRLPSDGGSSTANSTLTIGGIDSLYLSESDYSSIIFQPIAATSVSAYEHWTLSLSGLSVTDSNGTTSPIPISFAGQRTVNPTVVLDSGSSLNYAPSQMLDALYGAFVDSSGNRIGPGQNGICE